MKQMYVSPSLTVYGGVNSLTRAASGTGSKDQIFFATSDGGTELGQVTVDPDLQNKFIDCTYVNGSLGSVVLQGGSPSSCVGSKDLINGFDGSNIQGDESFLD